MSKRVIEREQSIIGRIFFIFKVNTVEKVLRDLFQLAGNRPPYTADNVPDVGQIGSI